VIIESTNIVTALTDADGSCRDLNFEGATWSGVTVLIRDLEASFRICSATADDGTKISQPLEATVLQTAFSGELVHLVFEDGAGFAGIVQVYISPAEDGLPFVELSFFPEDIKSSGAVRREFVEWVNKLQSQLGARRWFARYENASWKMGDTGPTSGVFAFSEEV
jgi:hypothetical protein